MNDNFTMIYDDLLSCKALSIHQRLIIAKAQSFNRSGGSLYASQEKIADMLGTSIDTVKRAIKGLKSLPFMQIESQGLKKPLVISVDNDKLSEYIGQIALSHSADCTMAHSADCTSIILKPYKNIDKTKKITTGLSQQAGESALSPSDSNESSSDTDKPKDGLAEKEVAGPLASELGDEFPICKTAVGIMNKLRREEGFTALYTSRMKREQWARCEANLDTLFADNATDGDLEAFIFDMVEGKLKNLPRITLNHIAATYCDEDSLGGGIVGHITDHHGIDGNAFAY